MKIVTTKDGLYKLEIVKIYNKQERFFGKVLIKHEGCKTPTRFDIIYFNSIVEEQDKILI
jgi:hypothetical protein